jgi:8-oxo-dGTP diphosphatase
MRLFATSRHKKWMDSQPRRMSSGAMMLENERRELLVIKANYKNYWTLPGGIVDYSETPKQAAIRETSEEVGILLDPAKVTFVAVVDRISSDLQTYQFIFKAPVAAGAFESIALQASEIDEYAFVSKAQVLAGDRIYGQAIYAWANDVSGYIEQTFESEKEIL